MAYYLLLLILCGGDMEIIICENELNTVVSKDGIQRSRPLIKSVILIILPSPMTLMLLHLLYINSITTV